MLCGMHVHVNLPDPSRRVDVMTRMLPYLPLFIALSTSSPFWQGRVTGLKGYRLAAYDELPRTGLPELFHTNAEYNAYVGAMLASGAIQDVTHKYIRALALQWPQRPYAGADRRGNETASCRSGGDRRGAGGWGRACGKNGA